MNIVKELRLRAGLQQKEVAIAVGVSRPTVSEWEHQKKDPTGERLRRLADLFDVDTGVVLGFQIGDVGIETVGDDVIRIPVLGSIPAGIPIEAVEDVDGWEELPKSAARGGKEFFALRVHGDSMYPEYRDGDTIVLQKAETCENGDDCAVSINGDDAVFKRVRRNEYGIMLQPLNPAYTPATYTNAEIEELPVKILGVVRELRRKIK